MIILLSPAKKLNEQPVDTVLPIGKPYFLSQSKELAKIMQSYDENGLKKLMGVSDNIAAINVRRYQGMANSKSEGVAALYMFKGDVYANMGIDNYGKNELQFAEKHLRILSGLYGLLKPLDAAMPYRLEMGTSLVNAKGNNLYKFWGDSITDKINQDNDSGLVINLASNEYFKAVNTKKLNGKLINIQFKEKRETGYKIISFSAKRARGMMADYIIKNKITNVDDIKTFNISDYQFSKEMSADSQLVFARNNS